MDTYWLPIRDCPNYSVSNYGEVRNNKTGRIMKLTKTQHNVLKVGLWEDGKFYTRSVKVLVAEAFVPRTPRSSIYNPIQSPAQRDGNPLNVSADNLVWRTRSFCTRYARQFSNGDRERYSINGPRPIVDKRTGEIYDNIWDVAITNCLLATDVLHCVFSHDPVQPTMQVFTWKGYEHQYDHLDTNTIVFNDIYVKRN